MSSMTLCNRGPCVLHNITDVIGVITACLGSIEKQLFRVSHFIPVGTALASFSHMTHPTVEGILRKMFFDL